MSPSVISDYALASRTRRDARALASAVLPILDRAKRELDGDVQAAEVHIAEASALLKMEIDRRARQDPPGGPSGGLARWVSALTPLLKWRLRRVQDHVEAHIADPLSLADLAAVAGLSRMHFAAQFRAATGFSPHEYVLVKRIDHAKAMLREGDGSLAQIALSVGFQARAHFSTVFKRITGDTPARWRRASFA